MKPIRTAVLATAFCVALLGTAGSPAHAADSTAAATAGKVAAVSSPATSSATVQRASTYWTKERMLAAKPVPAAAVSASEAKALLANAAPQGAAGKADPATTAGDAAGASLAADPGATAATWAGSSTTMPGSTAGKVFFTGSDGLNYVCSGTAINSTSKRVVFTAGHCVARYNQWYNQQPWIFVPGYNNGNAPYGQWTAAQLWTLNAWLIDDNRAHDIGAAVMNLNASGQRLVNVVGGQGIEWNYPLVQYMFQFGYPTRTPFNGLILKYCTGNSYNDGGFEGINCNMTEGASGGAWLDNFGGSSGWLDGVNSWVFWNSAGVRYKWNSPYFGNNARDLYNSVASL